MKKYFLLLFFIYISSVSAQNYTTSDFITGLTNPIAFDFLPDGNVIVTQQYGLVRIYNSSGQGGSTFWDFTDSCLHIQDLGTIGVAHDPAFQTNHFIYVYYVHKIPPVIGDGQDYYHRIIRFTDVNDAGASPVKIFEYRQNVNVGQNHAAGNIYFGPDNKLYFSLGDLGGAAQSLNSPRGKILRINTDGSSPADNPFYDDGNPNTGNDDRIWAMGLRNPFDFCFSPVNDSLYASENGDLTDEIDYIRKGKNYGYPVCQGICGNPLYRDPILQLPGAVPTGVIVYNGNQFPALYNKLLFASYSLHKIYKCDLGNAPLYDTITLSTEWITLPNSSSLTAIRQGADGNIYTALYGMNKIIKISPQVGAINNHGETVNFSLEQNYPNPFNPFTNIKYEIINSKYVVLKVFDVIGNEVITLVNQKQEAGSHEVEWDASNYPSGVYFYKLTVDEQSIEKKMVLIK